MEDHRSHLSKICRICFKLLAKKGFSTKKFHEIINKAFFINTTTDDEHIHLTQICQKCYLKRCYLKRKKTTSINPFNNWNAHFDDNCQICDTVKLLSRGVTGIQKIHKPHKKYPGGRPASEEKSWNESVPNKLNALIPLNSIHSNIRVADLDEHKNTHISLCKCRLCTMFLGDLLQ